MARAFQVDTETGASKGAFEPEARGSGFRFHRNLNASSHPFFIDVSEIYELGRKGGEIFGIARVILEVAHELCKTGEALPVVNDEARRAILAVDPSVFAAELLYDRSATTDQLGRPGKHRDLERYEPGSFRRVSAGMRNVVSGFQHRLTSRTGSAITGSPDLSGGTILCLGSLSSSRRTLEQADRNGSLASAIVLIHDVIRFMNGPETISPRTIRSERCSMQRCDEMGATWVANSEFTRQDTLRAAEDGTAPKLRGEIEVIPLAHEIRPVASPVQTGLIPEEPYLLTVGGVDGRKNGALLFDALLMLRERFGNGAVPAVAVAGRHEPRGIYREFAQGGRYAAIASSVRWVDAPDQATLRALYEHASALVYPSRYEGFGLPVGEALWMGTPVFASNATSIPEVGRDLARYFDAEDTEALAGLIRGTLNDEQAMTSWRARIDEGRGDLRTWGDVARDYVALAAR